MGTNYYWESDPCGCCGHVAERRHICKSLTSWAAGVTEADPAFDEATLTSWGDWRGWLETAGGRIVDEYGVVIPFDQFVEDVAAVPKDRRRTQHDYVRANQWSSNRIETWPLQDRRIRPNVRRHWLSPEGFSFTDGEFC